MDAAAAALIGAGIGASSTVVVSFVGGLQAQRSRRRDLKRDAYAAGFSALVGVGFAKNAKQKLAVYQEILSALGRIEMFGSQRAAKSYNEFAEALEEWANDGAVGQFKRPVDEFQRSARAEIGSDGRLHRLRGRRMWTEQNHATPGQ